MKSEKNEIFKKSSPKWDYFRKRSSRPNFFFLQYIFGSSMIFEVLSQIVQLNNIFKVILDIAN